MEAIRSAIEDATPRGIADGIARLIRAGDLGIGQRLPTVRTLAQTLGVSPATVSAAWQTLADAGLIVSRGRNGTTVREVAMDWMPFRYQRLEADTTGALDLSQGIPDSTMLPRQQHIIRSILDSETRGGGWDPSAPIGYRRKPDIPELHDLLREGWPSPVETLTVVDGALDAVDRALMAIVRFGDRAVVEAPTFPPVLDLLDVYGVRPIGVQMDEHGMLPDAFAEALLHSPSVVFLQPRAQNPTGISMSAERAAELAAILDASKAAVRAIVIEDDHSDAISNAPPVTLAAHLPDRVLHVRSFSKSHGPDLRIGALGGPRPIVDRIVWRRLLGPGWTSRMTQMVLHRLLTDPEAVARVEVARATYASRQRAFASAMTSAGAAISARDGINAWVPVRDEQMAMLRLAAAGIRVAPGTPFQVAGCDTGPHLRVTVGVINGDPTPIAMAIADAAMA